VVVGPPACRCEVRLDRRHVSSSERLFEMLARTCVRVKGQIERMFASRRAVLYGAAERMFP
jgi:hypothetical protein